MSHSDPMELKARCANSYNRLVVGVAIRSSGEARGGDLGRNFLQRLVAAMESGKSLRSP